MDTKIHVLDSLRAFAALSVCLFHFVCTTTGYVTYEPVLNAFTPGQYGVQLFFVISGFVIPWSMKVAGYRLRNFLLFFLKRLASLEPPYVFSVLLALAILFLRSRVMGLSNDHMTLSAGQIGAHFFYLVPFFDEYKWLNQVYWTLAIEFQYYIFMGLAFSLLHTGRMWLRVLVYAVCLFSVLLSSTSFLPHWLPVFLVGILLYLFVSGEIKTTEYGMAMAATFIVCFLSYPPLSLFFVLIPVVAVLAFRQARVPVLDRVGAFSYSIYLVHPLIGASVINLLSHRFTAAHEKVLVILLGLAVTLFFSWIMYICIERPSKRLSSSIRYSNHDGHPGK